MSTTAGLKTLPSPPIFIIDQTQENIVISGLTFTFAASSGAIQWSLSYDQYNKTQATGSPNNATLLIDLLDINGAIVPGPQIKVYPRHNFCGARHEEFPDQRTDGYPEGVDLLSVIASIRLRCEAITYGVNPC